MLKAGILGTIGAVIAVLITFLIADAASGPLLVTAAGADVPEEAPLSGALLFTVVGGVIGVGVAALCKRFLGNPVPAFLGICVVGLIIFGIFPFTVAEEVATGVWLNVMHIAAAIPIVGLLAKELQSPNAS